MIEWISVTNTPAYCAAEKITIQKSFTTLITGQSWRHDTQYNDTYHNDTA